MFQRLHLNGKYDTVVMNPSSNIALLLNPVKIVTDVNGLIVPIGEWHCTSVPVFRGK